MRVNIYQTVEVSDDQRRAIAVALHGTTDRRGASREDLKDFIWQHGAGWEAALAGPETPDEDDEDLLGTPGDDDAEEDLLGTADDADDEEDADIDEDDLL